MRGYFLSVCLLSTIILFECFAAAAEIHDAARAGDLAKIEALLTGDPSLVNSLDENQKTPLHLAIEGNHLEVAEFLIRNGADVNAVDYTKSTPLHYAAISGRYDEVKLLLDNGAEIEARNTEERTPLFLASVWGRDLETCRLLIERGAQVNVLDFTGSPPFSNAIFMGNTEIVDLLLDSGVLLPEEGRPLLIMLSAAAGSGMARPFRLLVEKCEKQGLPWWESVPLHDAAAGGSVEIAEMIMAKGADPNAKNNYGLAPIHIAADKGHADFVAFLLEHGASIDARSMVGKTALHYAREAGHEDVVEALVAKGASQAPPEFPEMKGDYLGQTPPGDTPEIFAIGIVSDYGMEAEHSPAVFSPDGNELFWTKQFRGPILFMRRVNGLWTAPEKAPFNSEFGDGEPFFTPDGNKLLFLSFRPLEAGGRTDKESLWSVKRTNGGWSEPKPVSPSINAYELHWEISISAKGTVYFSADHGGGLGKRDIYCSRLVDGQYEQPANLGSPINTEGIEHTPFIAPDESYIIFSSDGHQPIYGGLDLFISYKNDDGSWTDPINLGEKINTYWFELWPAITPDGKYMFFLRGEIMWVDAGFIEELRPRK
jgi:ankyrin repeat protein